MERYFVFGEKHLRSFSNMPFEDRRETQQKLGGSVDSLVSINLQLEG